MKRVTIKNDSKPNFLNKHFKKKKITSFYAKNVFTVYNVLSFF